MSKSEAETGGMWSFGRGNHSSGVWVKGEGCKGLDSFDDNKTKKISGSQSPEPDPNSVFT